MSEIINGRTIFSLLEVTKSIQKTIAERYKSSYWIKAEMNKLNYYPHSGHCYPDLMEKHEGKVIAQFRANIWSDDYQRINNEFQAILKESLRDGIKILFLAQITFRPEYGLSLRILDIDPNFTLGDLEREKQETIQKLKAEGLFWKNKSLKLPLLPQRIAVISVQTSKGYADFLKVLDSASHSFGFHFFHMLFPSLLQGEKAVDSVQSQLKRIEKVMHYFDLVAIIRGGGGDVGLSCYNHFELAKSIALFPLPVITGIGHATNETVVEMAAFENAITPTHLAEILVQKFNDFLAPVQNAQERITERSLRLLGDEKTKFHSEIKLFRSVTSNIIGKNKNRVRTQVQTLFQQSQYVFKRQRESLNIKQEDIWKGTGIFFYSANQNLIRQTAGIKKDIVQSLEKKKMLLSSMKKNITNMNPQNVLKRGYSITLLKGKAVRSFEQVIEGDLLETLIHKGQITSIVKSSKRTSKT
jgi:exodeoxyribonuclease VII large subunit